MKDWRNYPKTRVLPHCNITGSITRLYILLNPHHAIYRKSQTISTTILVPWGNRSGLCLSQLLINHDGPDR